MTNDEQLMTQITLEEIQQFRQKLAHYPPAVKALNEIEDCEGDLGDAVISLAIRAGQEPQQESSEWLTSLAKRCRAAICQEVLRENLQSGSLDKAAIALANLNLIPAILAVPVLIYVLKQGLDNFCKPLEKPV